MDFWFLAFVSGLAFLVFLILLFAVGSYAVTKHPGRYDPARNAKRYTVTAGVSLVLALISAAATFSFALAGILT